MRFAAVLPVHEARRLVCCLAAAALCLLATACSSTSATSSPTASPERRLPRNVFLESARVAPDLKRVAVLPLSAGPGGDNLVAGCEALQGLFAAELMATRRFEFVLVSPDQCRAWTGKKDWTVSDQLPRDLLARVRQETGCDALLLSQLTHYRPYPPVAVGWRTQLISVEPLRVLWAVDELFDGGDPEVADAARSHYKHRFGSQTGSDPQSILTSPRRFGQFTAAAVASTLPGH